MQQDGASTGSIHDDVAVGTVRVCIQHCRISVDGASVALSPRELDVLSVLAQRPGTVVNKHQLLNQVWKGAADGHAVEVTIGRLRRRLDGMLQIETVPRRGYRLVIPSG